MTVGDFGCPEQHGNHEGMNQHHVEQRGQTKSEESFAHEASRVVPLQRTEREDIGQEKEQPYEKRLKMASLRSPRFFT